MDFNYLDSLSNLKYYDLLKIAKEKAVVKKRVSKGKLIEIIRASIVTLPEDVSEPNSEQTKQGMEPEVETLQTDKSNRKNPMKAKRMLKGTPVQKKGMGRDGESPSLNSTFTLEEDANEKNSGVPPSTPSITAATPNKAAKVERSTKIPKIARPAPNFAQLHQKNFNKMQSVDEYVEKKRLRTATLTSSTKPNRVRPVVNTPGSTVKAPPLKFDFTSGLGKPVFTAKGSVAVEKKRVFAAVKENVTKANCSSLKVDISKPTTLKSVSQNPADKKRAVLKGVRTNRRFDLLMRHRESLKLAD